MPPLHRWFVTAAKGTEEVLRDELAALGLERVRPTHGGVWFRGPLTAGMKAVLWTRIGQRVLLRVGSGAAPDEEALYALVGDIQWERHLDLAHTFAVRATVRSSTLSHSRFVALKTKDAIVDRLRAKLGARPDVDAKNPDVLVSVHLASNEAQVYLDFSGESLHRRGWRIEAGEAPLRETLAAAVLALGRHDPEAPFCDPMCGSGTLVIEAALRARRMAPGLGRRFGFMRWPAFADAGAEPWKALEAEAQAQVLPKAPAPLIGRDHDPELVGLARRNARRAGVADDVHFEVRDARDLGDLPDGCQLFTNPPYGERLGGKRLQLEGFYRQLGLELSRRPEIRRAVVLAGTPVLERAFGQRSRISLPVYNGPLECRLLEFQGPARRE